MKCQEGKLKCEVIVLTQLHAFLPTKLLSILTLRTTVSNLENTDTIALLDSI